MKKLLFFVTHACYFLVILTVGLGALGTVCFAARELFKLLEVGNHFSLGPALGLAIAVSLLYLPYTAVRRLGRGDPLLPWPQSRKQAATIVLITAFGLVGHYAASILVRVGYDLFWASQGREAPNAIGLVLLMSTTCYLLALWLGEMVLLRDQALFATEPTGSDQ